MSLPYSKHPHIRTLISGFRLIVFLFIGRLVRNQPESVLKLFLKLFQKDYSLYITRGLINVQCFITCTKKMNFKLKTNK